MEEKWTFQYRVQKPLPGPVVELSGREVEELLLKRLEKETEKREEILWELARLYSSAGNGEKSLAYFREIMNSKPDVEGKARCVLAMGCTMEKVGNFEAAVQFYKEAFAMEPMNSDTWYWIHNNLGYSLNTLGRFAEGEGYCRKATQIEPNRANAFKNLGISLEGLGDYTEAARCFLWATRVDAADPRSLKHLETLVANHPELQFEFGEKIEFCRKAVAVAASTNARSQPVVYRGWRKRLFLWKMKLRKLWPRKPASS